VSLQAINFLLTKGVALPLFQEVGVAYYPFSERAKRNPGSEIMPFNGASNLAKIQVTWRTISREGLVTTSSEYR